MTLCCTSRFVQWSTFAALLALSALRHCSTFCPLSVSLLPLSSPPGTLASLLPPWHRQRILISNRKQIDRVRLCHSFSAARGCMKNINCSNHISAQKKNKCDQKKNKAPLQYKPATLERIVDSRNLKPDSQTWRIFFRDFFCDFFRLLFTSFHFL